MTPQVLQFLPPDRIAWPQRDVETAGVAEIVERVRREGDAGVGAIAAELGDSPPREVTREAMRAAYDGLTEPLRAAIESAASRIERFARAQRAALGEVAYDLSGFRVGHRMIAVERAGVYVPAGRHPLPSSLLMGAIPARVAGVAQVVVCTPRALVPILAAAFVAGVDRLFELGGPQAIAALAFGTESVPRVDIIVGPGNGYVTAAKRLVFGSCGIDALAGPSELVVIASSNADPACIAADLLAQAEHDVDARVLLMTDDPVLLAGTSRALLAQLDSLRTAAVARAALARNGCCAVLPLHDAIAVANGLAPEHLSLQGELAEALASQATAYGALFIGSRSAEAFADYGVGPTHVLPTGSSARFSGGLSVFTFLNARTFVQAIGPIDPQLIDETVELASCEGLDAHAEAAMRRLSDPSGCNSRKAGLDARRLVR